MVISKLNFSKVFAEAWLKHLTQVNIVTGFKVRGIYLFNQNVIPFSNEGSGEDEPSTSSRLNGKLDLSLNINSSTTPGGTLNLSCNSAASYEFTISQLISFQLKWALMYIMMNTM